MNFFLCQFRRRAVKDQLSGSNTQNSLGILHGNVHLVEIDNTGDLSGLVDLRQMIHNGFGCFGIQRGDGFITENQFRLLHDGTGNSHTLFLTAGKRIAAFIRLIRQSQFRENGERLFFFRFRVMSDHAAESGLLPQSAVQNIFHNTQTFHQVIMLKNHSGFGAHVSQLSLAQGHNIFAVIDDFSLCCVDQTVDTAQNGRFSGTGWSDDGDELTFIHGKTQIVQRPGRVMIHLTDVLEL